MGTTFGRPALLPPKNLEGQKTSQVSGRLDVRQSSVTILWPCKLQERSVTTSATLCKYEPEVLA